MDTSGAPGPVLCAVDHSPHAGAVAYNAAGMAMQFGRDVVLLRSDPRVNGSDVDQMRAQGDLEKLALTSIAEPTGRAVKVRTTVIHDAPADGIRRYVAAAEPLMVLMGSRGRRGLRRSLFGSTALSLMRHAPVPLVVVPPSDPEVFTVMPEGVRCHMGSVLVPVDFSDAMDSQLQFAGAFLAAETCPVTLLHVAKKGEQARRADELHQVRERMTAGGRVTPLVVEGEVHPVLRDLLQGDDFGMVILGRDRHRAGTVASDLLHLSTALVAVAS
ncbi:MAG: universal stress protein [Vicinamibacterales bacterium]